MGQQGFNRQWMREFERAFNQNSGWSPWGDWGGDWGGRGRGPGRPGRPGRPGGHGGHGGPPPWVAGLLGFTPEPPPQRGPRVRRGDVRSAILDILRAAGERDEAINGYQVIQQIAERSKDAWRPSPGSVYPTIQQLEDEGLVEGDDTRGRRALRLTHEGWEYVSAHAADLRRVWRPFDAEVDEVDMTKGSGEGVDLRSEIGQVMGAVWQIVSSGSERQRRAAIDVLVEARRALYGILADGREGPAEPTGAADGDDVIDVDEEPGADEGSQPS